MLCALGVLTAAPFARSQEPSAPQAVAPASFQAAIDNLGKLDYEIRTSASRTIRRTPASQAVPALVTAARTHQDGYVKYRALVLLTGFNDPGTEVLMRDALTDVNDRLRTVAYEFFEHHPDRSMIPALLASLEKEDAEFVRPALIRTLAALGDDPRIASVLVREAGRGEDFFRSAVIEALGDYKRSYALDALTAIARQDGPLQDDAILAIGRIGDPRAYETIAAAQRNSAAAMQPIIGAALCLLGSKCDEEETYLTGVLKASGENRQPQEVVRSAATSLGALGIAGRSNAAEALMSVGLTAPDAIRAPIALAVATLALRSTPFAFTLLEKNPAKEIIGLLAEGFDMLEEDFEKERFFALARKTYWNAPEGSPRRVLMQTLIGELDF